MEGYYGIGEVFVKVANVTLRRPRCTTGRDTTKR